MLIPDFLIIFFTNLFLFHSVSVLQGTHARFILASDGFWDVVSVEAVRCVGLSDKYKYVTMIQKSTPTMLPWPLKQRMLARYRCIPFMINI